MENVLSYVKKVINFIRSRGLNQRQFTTFLSELDSEYSGTLVILLQDSLTILGFERRNMSVFRNEKSRRKFVFRSNMDTRFIFVG